MPQTTNGRKNLIEFAVLMFISTLLAGSFCLYLLFIGIPKTQARNHYNLGAIAEEKGDLNTAKYEYEEALRHWDEKYIEDALQKINDSSSQTK